jgi:hypothetical protein
MILYNAALSIEWAICAFDESFGGDGAGLAVQVYDVGPLPIQ